MTDLLLRAEQPVDSSVAAAPVDRQIRWRRGEMITQGQDAKRLFRLTSGWAYRARFLEDGRRQILSFFLSGDTLNASSVLGGDTEAPLYALTDVHLSAVAGDGLNGLKALLWQASLLNEHVVSLGRRTAYERLAFFLLQTADRLDPPYMSKAPRYAVPLRQEHVADHLGLSVVHVSRTLGQLNDNGFARLHRGVLEIRNRAALSAVCDYRPARRPTTALV